MLYLFVFATCNAASKIYVSGFPHVFTTCWVYRGGLPGILTCGVGWGVSTLVFMCTHGTLLVC